MSIILKIFSGVVFIVESINEFLVQIVLARNTERRADILKRFSGALVVLGSLFLGSGLEVILIGIDFILSTFAPLQRGLSKEKRSLVICVAFIIAVVSFLINVCCGFIFLELWAPFIYEDISLWIVPQDSFRNMSASLLVLYYFAHHEVLCLSAEQWQARKGAQDEELNMFDARW